MPIYIDGVCIHDRAAWLEHKKLKRELILNSRLVRGGYPEYRKECLELKKKIEVNKCLAQVASDFRQ
jgi:hypothetical protein